MSFIVTSVEAFLAEIPDTDYNLFLPQNDKIKEEKSPPNHLLRPACTMFIINCSV